MHLNKAESTDRAEKQTVGILNDSRTVVEKDGMVTTGIMTYAEGDIMEIEIRETDWFKLGDSVKLSIYSLGGIYIVQSTVIAKDEGVLVVLNPPDTQRKFLNRREYPRVELELPGVIYAINDKSAPGKMTFQDPVPLKMQNISLNGLGFLLQHPIQIDRHSHVELSFEIGVPIECIAEVVRSDKHAEGIYYGARLVSFPEERQSAMKAFILATQIRHRAELRKQSKLAKVFKI